MRGVEPVALLVPYPYRENPPMTITVPIAPLAPSPFLTEAQAAARLGLAPKTLRNFRSAGVGPTALRLGRSVRYHIEALDGWALGQVAA
jgi:hypothetical protein